MEPSDINNAAAVLFWTLAHEVGVEAATQSVISTQGMCLLDQPTTAQVLSENGALNVPEDKREATFIALADEALSYATNGVNNYGFIYGEDAESGRSPSAEEVQTGHLRNVPKCMVQAGLIVELGTLCIRHPLPAVVFCEIQPKVNFIKVANTVNALGFSMPMYLVIGGKQQVGENLHVLMGTFYIPAQDAQKGAWWMHPIPNAACFSDRFNFELPAMPDMPGELTPVW